ncbi:probable galacturonosyltransferase 6 isoform X2 [Punica granatum]|uniref:Hexosyltransferase n=2 Tax=Punica granatum TaxID=22663 RepID=A0A218VRA8_PUNGR|nr:probable galacturonosyltransferase 6 isoform X2 [Punica granatum]OWM63074.1 hypothetical protein CDL15_Pgr024639 [Punica granatum]
MRSVRQCQRIFFLCLFSVSVFAPIVFVSRRLQNISSIGRKEFIEDISAVKHRPDVLKLNSDEQEGGQSLKEPKLVVYEDRGFGSVANYSASDKIDGDVEDSIDAGDKPEVQRNGTSTRSSKEDQKMQKKVVPTKSHGKDDPTRTVVQRIQKSPARGSTDKKVKEMKDQLVRAKAYLNFAPPGSNSHFVKELKLRIKELERAMGDPSKDTNLSRSAWQKSRAMEASLSKASHIYSDCSAMATKLRAMTYNAEEQVRVQQDQAAYLLHLAARTTLKGLHCLTMRLTAEYFALLPEERKFDNQQKVHDQDLHHYAIFSDNVLACAVVVNSTVSSALDPEKIVFHIVTDSLNLPAISMWFLLNPPVKATLDIRSMQDFEWLSPKRRSALEKHNSRDPRYTSALNHLRFYLPDVFPLLNKILLFDHDVVVQRDLSELWNVNMMGKVNGAVQTCQEGEGSFRRMDTYINFSDPFVSERFDPNSCTWAFGMNLFDLQEWRRQNLTAVYSSYLQMNGRDPLWKAGSLPLGWLIFYNQTVPLDKRWQILGLGYDSGIPRSEIDRAAVIHYDGVMKPWLEIGIGKYKGYWSRRISYHHPYLQQCNIHE